MGQVKHVTVYLRGGLGNQLFQYAAGVALSRRTKANLLIDARLLPLNEEQISGVSHRPEEISSFHHEGELVGRNLGQSFQSKNFARLLQLERAAGDVFGSAALRLLGSIAAERRDLLEFFLKRQKPARINSYCSHQDYFSDYAEEIIGQINSLVAPSSFYYTHLQRLAVEKPIGLHYRLGDYRNLQHIYGSLTAQYFESGLLTLGERYEGSKVWVFSDEPLVAREKLGLRFKDAYYVPNDSSSRPLESLLLLSKLTRKILSNSTFSWWAAYLGHSTQVATIFPRPLSGPVGPKETQRYLLDGWCQVDR